MPKTEKQILQEKAVELGYDTKGKNMGQLKKLIDQGPNPDAQKQDLGPKGESGPGPHPQGEKLDEKTNEAEQTQEGENSETKKETQDGKDDTGGTDGKGTGGADLQTGAGDAAKKEEKKPDPAATDKAKEIPKMGIALKCYNIVELANGRKQYEFEALPNSETNKSFSSGVAMATLALVVDEGTEAHERFKLNESFTLILD